MKIFEELFLLQRIDHLIRTRASGTPQHLASKLGVSQCTIYRLLDSLKTQGFPIEYDRYAQSYYYREPVQLNVDFRVGEKSLLSIKGGRSKEEFFLQLADFESSSRHFCNAS